MAILDMLTPEQKTAITDHGGALLVSAAAGSGKTFVLIQRLLEQICDPREDCNIDDFLIITFTNAAAAELRDRVSEGISERMTAAPNDRHLRRQQMLCHRAHISTIHSFCSSLIRENAAQAGIAPDFRLADEKEAFIIQQKTIDDLLENCYTDMSDDFATLLDMLSSGENDVQLSDLILRAYRNLQSHPYPDDWCDRHIAELDFSSVCDLSGTVWGQEIISYAQQRAKYYRSRLQSILNIFSGDQKLEKAYAPSFISCMKSLESFETALEIGWDEAVKYADISLPRVSPLRGEGYDEAKAVKDLVKDSVKEFGTLFSAPSATFIAEMKKSAPAIRELLNLVKRFGKMYSAAKRSRGVIDYNDQEHLALRLLVDYETGKPTDIARGVSERFKEIMVDEYQDVNMVQEMIVSSVSKDGKNLFMVGDIKQSIYRFRLADPSIFIAKYNRYPMAADAAGEEPRKVILSRNFRSRKGVLDAVNFLFANVMSTELGELDYTPKEYLYAGAPYPQSDVPCAELAVLNTVKDKNAPPDEEEKIDKVALEADWVARRILALKSRLQIRDGEVSRPAKWSDFTILLRSTANRGNTYISALEGRGIPVVSGIETDFYNQPEISFMLSLLSVIDNPRQDIPLISVLRSPVYGFTPDELADIRLRSGRDFFDSLVLSGEENEKSASFLSQLEDFRREARELSADRLVWHIYNVTDLTAIYGAMQQGEERRRNLMLLFEEARQYEENGFKGLFQFITAMRQKIDSPSKPEQTYNYSGEDAVQIMSIHKSKGLEFPVVFIPDLAHGFNEKSLEENILLHRDLGVGAKIIDSKRGIRFPTLAHKAVAKRLKRESLSEEMRVLYVGMTRAKEKLILSAMFVGENFLNGKSLCSIDMLPPDPETLKTAKSMASWIVPTILKGFGDQTVESSGTEALWKIQFETLKQESILEEARLTPVEQRAEMQQSEMMQTIRERLSFVYPYASSVDLPSKLAPTELKGRAQDEEAQEEAGETPKLVGKRQRGRGEIRRPEFASHVPLTAAGKGTALHCVMQYADWKHCVDTDAIKAEINRLIEENRITSEQAETVDPALLLGFFTSPEGKMALSAPDLMKEFKFSVLMPASDFFEASGDDRILVQGVVDCCFEVAGKLVIIDFKTDRVTAEGVLKRAEEYSGQLNAYASAMESITGKKVSRKILYFMTPGVAVDL